MSDEIEMMSYAIGGTNFNFTAVGIGELDATEYTLATVAVDLTGSTYSFKDQLRQMLSAVIKDLQKSPRSANMLVRVIAFSDDFPTGVWELHGFKPLDEIDVNKDYPEFEPSGMTPLYDATFSAVGATVEYGRDLRAKRFKANAIIVIVTDGDDNASVKQPRDIDQEVAKGRAAEQLESILTILVGINAAHLRHLLEQFQREAGLDRYIDAGDVKDGSIARVAGFISHSVSSTSMALGSGGPSQDIAATI